jgi:DNA-directed RNA polymerase subunit RPC12/RpoP
VNVANVVIAILAAWAILALGLAILRGLARPIPEPPPAGELRKVKLNYRCSICGAEVRMTVAPNEDPDPPRHCQEEMDIVAPIE